MRVHYGANGKQKVTGKKALKASQRYSRQFADKAIDGYEAWYLRHRPSQREACTDSSDSDYESIPADEWRDADLEPLARMFVPSCARRFEL